MKAAFCRGTRVDWSSMAVGLAHVLQRCGGLCREGVIAADPFERTQGLKGGVQFNPSLRGQAKQHALKKGARRLFWCSGLIHL